MTGKDFYKIENNAELSQERLKSLLFFYGPLLGHDALVLYQYLVLKNTANEFRQFNELLSNLNLSINSFEQQCQKLNEYRLLRTFQKADHYILVFYSPLSRQEFIKDDIFVREFIMRTSGEHFRQLSADIYSESAHKGYTDISAVLKADNLELWDDQQESYLKSEPKKQYDFPTRFDVNVFLRDVSGVLLPMHMRTAENMLEMAKLADLYNISYDKMRTFMPKVALIKEDVFDLDQLKYLCMHAQTPYNKVGADEYDVPCTLYLMSLQDGKEVTDYDKKIISNLSERYHLPYPVINVLLEYCLKNCDKRLIEKYLYAVAADLHRNDIRTSEQAVQMLEKPRKADNKKSGNKKMPNYDTSRNTAVSKEEEEELLRLIGKNEQ